MSDQLCLKHMNTFYRVPTAEILPTLLEELTFTSEELAALQRQAQELVEDIRHQLKKQDPLQDVLVKYNLSSKEGIALMSLVEALLRVPDTDTAYALIRDKLLGVGWKDSIRADDRLLTRLSGKSLAMLERLMAHEPDTQKTLSSLLMSTATPLIHRAMLHIMRMFSHQFVMAEDIKTACKRAQKAPFDKYYVSYDMLGESARTYEMADKYYHAYDHALDVLIAHGNDREEPFDNPGISIKLSALHPRYQFAKKELLMEELLPKVRSLCRKAAKARLNVTIDAEEAARLELSFELMEKLLADNELSGWNGFGLALQAYQKRAYAAIDWLVALAQKHNQKIRVRLVKGAYWDAEVKYAQQQGFSGYPVYTRKALTDISYMACAHKLLKNRAVLFPQFATHNAYTVTSILQLAGDNHAGFEFQRLYGMGEQLYETLFSKETYDIACRMYVPIGPYQDLLPYLVRRLLENGANSSFVHLLADQSIPIEKVVSDPLITLAKLKKLQHPNIPRPRDIYQPERLASKGLDLADSKCVHQLYQTMEPLRETLPWHVSGLISGEQVGEEETHDMVGPTSYIEELGTSRLTTPDEMLLAYRRARAAFPRWVEQSVENRAAILEAMADILERDMPRFMYYCTMEAGKTLGDGVAEVREAVDFCRYYAALARTTMGKPVALKGYTGEVNELSLEGRGVFVCISPWNFPLAIFVGQIAAALVAGNTVLGKPAEPTPVIAYHAVKAFHEAGVPVDVLQLLLAPGKQFSDVILTQDIDGVAFTGSTATARRINQVLAQKEKIVPLIAETGGLNAMIVDSTSLPEQVVDAVVASAFQSAGQRCSALRLLYLQEEIADVVLDELKGAMNTLVVGDPLHLATDIGPVINFDAKLGLQRHIDQMIAKGGTVLHTTPRPPSLPDGSFVLPCLIELKKGSDLQEEAFGPVLHVVRFKSHELDAVIDEINASRYGLTLGVQTRLSSRAQYIRKRAKVGNVYVNRDMIGAVVGVQPFGGQGLSGTGPKAGGPHYLSRFTVEKTYTDNITASGGNAHLLNLSEEGA